MSYFDDASLVMIPSGYKPSTVFAVKPTDGTGDLTFTRSNDTATRVNSAGLIEKVRTNVALYSEDLTNAAWTKNRSSITANALANPVNGATTADYIVENTANGTHEAIQSFIVTSGVSYTISVYAKADTRTKIALVLAGSAFASGGNGQAIFNLSTGAVISAINGATARISSAGNGWYRCSITKASIDIAGVIALQLVDASDNTSYTGDGTSRAAFFGAQLEVSDFGATPYIATTTAAVSVGPVANVPRLDYLNSSCPRLLLEGQRTSLVTFSESFDNAAWSKDAVSVSANASTSPDGYVNADSIVENSATGFHFIQQTFTSSAVSTTYSIFAKLGSGTRTLILREGVNTGASAAFNLSTGVVAAQSGGTATITQYANGYYRCTLTFTAVAGTSSMQIALSNANSFASYAGNGTSSIIVYGAQVEAGAYATSYIPTLGAAVTRGADAASKTGISSLIGQTEGTLFVDMEFEGYDNQPKWIAFLGTGADYIGIYTTSDSKFLIEVATSGVTQFLDQSSLFSVGQRYKLAVAYKANDFALYINGTQVATDNSGTVPATSRFGLEYNTTANNLTARTYNQTLLFKTRLSNADLAALTA